MCTCLPSRAWGVTDFFASLFGKSLVVSNRGRFFFLWQGSMHPEASETLCQKNLGWAAQGARSPARRRPYISAPGWLSPKQFFRGLAEPECGRHLCLPFIFQLHSSHFVLGQVGGKLRLEPLQVHPQRSKPAVKRPCAEQNKATLFIPNCDVTRGWTAHLCDSPAKHSKRGQHRHSERERERPSFFFV